MAITTDSGLNAFLRIKNLEQQQIEADRIAAVADLRARRAVAEQAMSRGQKADQLGVNRQFESLGKYRSGGRVTALSTLAGDYNQQRLTADIELAGAEAQLGREASSRVTALDRQAELERIAALERLDQRRIQQAVLERELEQSTYSRNQYEAQIRFNQQERDRQQSRISSSGSGGGGSGGGFTGSSYSTTSPGTTGGTPYNYDRFNVKPPKYYGSSNKPPAPSEGTKRGGTVYY